ncbi:MAG: hypothetical protein HYV35_08625 [Lentisphaerae bacterium]|nr:hypothetical protein [Lentisphaerota bacterium]
MMNLSAYCAGKPLQPGLETVLLMDDATVEDRWGVRRVLNVPHKDPRNPVLMPEMAWEDAVAHPNVLFDERDGLFRMWYTGCDHTAWMRQGPLRTWRDNRDGQPYFVAYAESRDGVRWERPLLEGHSYLHHGKTNVVLLGRQKAQAARVMPTPPGMNRTERWMMTYKDNRPEGYGALCLAYSDDGINWQEDPQNPVFVGLQDTWQNMVFDPMNERWLMFTRPTCFAGVGGVPGGPTEINYKRRCAVMIGKTPYEFGQPRMVLWPEETDEPDFDHMIVSRVGSHFIGFLGQMSAPPRMIFTVHLAFSGDGLHWRQLPDRPAYLPHGAPDAFDSGSTWDAGGIVTIGNTMYIYYCGGRHGQAQGNRNNVVGMGRAQFRRDRFIAQMGAHTGGFLLTREMVVAAPELVVNTTVADGYNSDPAHATVPPEFAVEIVRRPEGGGPPRPVPGYTMAECTTKAVDLIEHRVTWKERSDLSTLVGQPVFIRFYLKNLGIYSLRFQSKTPT